MDPLQRIEVQRLAILDSLKAIRSMRRGAISEQYFPVLRQGQQRAERRGPYYVLSRHQGSKTISQRLTSPEALQQARNDIEAFKRFQALCREFERLTEQMGELERGQEKKRSKSWSSKTAK